MMNTKTIFAFVGVFLFCCSNIIFLEILVRRDPGIGNLVTFFQFVIFSLYGLIFTFKFGRAKRQIPLRKYSHLVILFFLSSFLNNYAFNFNVPMPLHMIFRSGSLMANMVLGIFILEKKYPLSKYLSVVMITVGIIICTIQTGSHIKDKPSPIGGRNNGVVGNENETAKINETLLQKVVSVGKGEKDDIFWLSIGIIILTVALFLSARMGIFQETLYAKYGKHPSEALFYTHALPLPLFLLIAPNLWNHWVISGESETLLDMIPLPSVRVYLVINSLAQCMCIASVYVLTSECTSLAVTMTVTLRKFVSLLFSIIYFKNPFTSAHWVGTFLIFTGTCLFTELLQKSMAVLSSPKYELLSQAESKVDDNDEHNIVEEDFEEKS